MSEPLTLETLERTISDLRRQLPRPETIWMGPGGMRKLEAKVISGEAPHVAEMQVFVCEALDATEFYVVPASRWLDALRSLRDYPEAQARILRGLTRDRERAGPE